MAAYLVACVEERERPGPPMLTLILDRATVRSPDTLTGDLRVEDSDGIDSVWLTVDASTLAQDASLDRVYSARFRMPIQAGHAPGTRLEVTLRARDLPGLSHAIGDNVTVIP